MQANSAAVAAKTEAQYGRIAEHAVLRHGIETRRAAGLAAGTARTAPAGSVVFLFVGRLEPRKGIDTFLRAAEALCESDPRAHFVVAGQDGYCPDGSRNFRLEFCQRRADLVEAGRVRFKGLLEDKDLYAEYAACDVFVMPSRFESFGLVMLEAMMFGKPVVVAASSTMTEVIADGRNGLVFDATDPDGLAGRLRRLLSDAGLRRKLGAGALATVAERYDVRHVAAEAVAIYRRVIERFRAGALVPQRAVSVAALVSSLIGRHECGLSEIAEQAVIRQLVGEETDLLWRAGTLARAVKESAGDEFRTRLGLLLPDSACLKPRIPAAIRSIRTPGRQGWPGLSPCWTAPPGRGRKATGGWRPACAPIAPPPPSTSTRRCRRNRTACP